MGTFNKNTVLPLRILGLSSTSVVLFFCCLWALGCKEKPTPKLDEMRKDESVIDPYTAAESPFQLKVSFKGPQNRETIRVAVEVTNKSNIICGWDKEFSVFLAWRLCVDEDDYWLQSVPILASIKQTQQSLSKTRFVQLRPMDHLCKTVVLTQPFRNFTVKSRLKSGHRHASQFHGYERMSKFTIPRHAKSLHVQLEYLGNWDGPFSFSSMFGFDMRDVHLWHGTCRSNTITLRFPN
jgi:hypothetical protein